MEPVEFPSAVIKNETDTVKIKSEHPSPKDEDILDIDIADQVFEEAFRGNHPSFSAAGAAAPGGGRWCG